MVYLLFQQIKKYFTESQHDNLSASINNVKPLVEILKKKNTEQISLSLFCIYLKNVCIFSVQRTDMQRSLTPQLLWGLNSSYRTEWRGL